MRFLQFLHTVFSNLPFSYWKSQRSWIEKAYEAFFDCATWLSIGIQKPPGNLYNEYRETDRR